MPKLASATSTNLIPFLLIHSISFLTRLQSNFLILLNVKLPQSQNVQAYGQPLLVSSVILKFLLRCFSTILSSTPSTKGLHNVSKSAILEPIILFGLLLSIKNSLNKYSDSPWNV